VIVLGAPLIAVVLLLGGPFEKWVHRSWPGAENPDES